MRCIWHPALVALALLILNGCSSLKVAEPSQDTLDWQSIKERLSRQSSWTLMGKIGVRTATDNATAAINKWTQVDDFFDVQLSSTFFGLGSARISGNARFVTLTESGEDPVYSDQPELLMESALGFPLPVSYLSHWIKALPVPDQPAELEFDATGKPSTMRQLGWHLEFSRYHQIDGLLLPGRIKLERDDSRIILAIKTWQLL